MKVIVDEEAVKNLDRALDIIPQIYSVIIDPLNHEIISGVHRHETGKTPKEFVLPVGFIEGIAKKLSTLTGTTVTREMAVVVLRQHLNIQRQPSEEEKTRRVLEREQRKTEGRISKVCRRRVSKYEGRRP